MDDPLPRIETCNVRTYTGERYFFCNDVTLSCDNFLTLGDRDVIGGRPFGHIRSLRVNLMLRKKGIQFFCSDSSSLLWLLLLLLLLLLHV